MKRRVVCLFVWIAVAFCLEAYGVEVESGYVPVDGGKIFYEVAGQGPAIVMIHDGLLHRETWDGQFQEFARQYRVIRWDRRGYGKSEASQKPYSNLDDLLQVMKNLKVERATLMACSAGGLMAIYFTIDHPDMVSSLVLVGPIVTGLSFSEHFSRRGDRGEPDAKAPVTEQIEYWTSKDPWIMAPENQAARARFRALLTANPQNLQPSPLSLWPKYLALGRLSKIKVPVLLLVGESDIPDVHAHVGAIEAGVHGAKRVVLTHCGHLAHMEVPDKFNQIVLQFLKDNAGGTSLQGTQTQQ